ncbi:SPRY domain-containing protein [Capsaspora owczarzaki ATCC 30864]|uniref:SPRY domain-containing protein n=1 Tax=Capsaspora owczarzaki (strain ATCC 30864) TaxID=595528 RepID=UPI0003526703|nr:SPRY domain-containing protein [Capsaspora owczarzaki ATCC 30864]|eukprot:XP_004349450.2 SPRY domain-containing protein [Capsaspora owczarzaki ATCC 30864]
MDDLAFYAENSDEDWCEIVRQMVLSLDLSLPLSDSVIATLIDSFPSPGPSTVKRVSTMLCETADECCDQDNVLRNVAIAFGVLAEKFAGQATVLLLSDSALSTLECLLDKSEPAMLYAIVALDKFCQTAKAKAAIMESPLPNKLRQLETIMLDTPPTDALRLQIWHCLVWILDNTVLLPDREPSISRIKNLDSINVMLDKRNTMSFVKVSADGLEARNDACTFETVRSSFGVLHGKWYLEVTLLSGGIMQIGWTGRDCEFDVEESGVGDNPQSFAFDGCRRVTWHRGEFINCPETMPTWKPNDVVGLMLDGDERQVIFWLNELEVGRYTLPPDFDMLLYPAASFMSCQQTRFNFGATPYKFPRAGYASLNDHGTLPHVEKIVPPKAVLLRDMRTQLSHVSDGEGELRCILCVDEPRSIRLLPCNHEGFCPDCAQQCDLCPLCRVKVVARQSSDEPAVTAPVVADASAVASGVVADANTAPVASTEANAAPAAVDAGAGNL